MELTTYYPEPNGEYKNVSTTDETKLASTTGSVTVGTEADPLPDAEKDNTLILRPVTGEAADQIGDEEGSIRYSKDANGGAGGLLYRNSGSWAALVGGGGGFKVVKARDTVFPFPGVTVDCGAGFQIIQCGDGGAQFSDP